MDSIHRTFVSTGFLSVRRACRDIMEKNREMQLVELPMPNLLCMNSLCRRKCPRSSKSESGAAPGGSRQSPTADLPGDSLHKWSACASDLFHPF